MTSLKRFAGVEVRRLLGYVPFWLRFRRVRYGYELRQWYRRIMFSRIFWSWCTDNRCSFRRSLAACSNQ